MYSSLHLRIAIPFPCELCDSKNWWSGHGRVECKGNLSRSFKLTFGSQPISSRVTSRVVCQAVKDKAKFARDQLTEDQLATWDEASAVLVGVGFDSAEADQMLGKAYGWTHSPYWTEKLEKTVPDAGTISSRLDFVKSVGFSDAEVAPVLKKFPEVLGIRETLMEHNIGKLDKDWFISGKMLKTVVKRNPHSLGYNVDCRGDCMAQCTRCWARF